MVESHATTAVARMFGNLHFFVAKAVLPTGCTSSLNFIEIVVDLLLGLLLLSCGPVITAECAGVRTRWTT
jgi:hypothetical protein